MPELPRWSPLAFLIISLSPLNAQNPGHADRLWIAAGVGGGWNLYKGLEDGSEPNFAGYVRLGGTPMRSLLLGGEAMGWVRRRPDPIPVDNLVFYALNIGPVAILYPINERPFYVKAGLGVALVGLSVDPLVGFPVPSDHQGIGGTVEVGVDLLDVGDFTLNPSVSWGGQSFGSQSGNLRRIGSNTFLLITLGIRVR